MSDVFHKIRATHGDEVADYLEKMEKRISALESAGSNSVVAGGSRSGNSFPPKK